MEDRAKMIERVRALLAKANGTDNPDEARVFFAKAQELMSKHAIDEIREQVKTGDFGLPISFEYDIDGPYAYEKTYLMHRVCLANRCRLVHLGDIYGAEDRERVWTAGFESDLDNVEMLYTALLAHSTIEMIDAVEAHVEAQGHKRDVKDYKGSFLTGYAIKVGERLEEMNRTVEEAAEQSTALAIVDRKHTVDDMVNEKFPYLGRGRSTRNHNAAGYNAGNAAGSRADIGRSRLGGSRGALGSG